jgi:hypothetical protein
MLAYTSGAAGRRSFRTQTTKPCLAWNQVENVSHVGAFGHKADLVSLQKSCTPLSYVQLSVILAPLA